MHLLPLVLALALSPARADSPPRLAFPPELKEMIDPKAWDVFGGWQQRYILNAARDRKWPAKNGISDKSWSISTPQMKGGFILKALHDETENRFDLEVDRLYVQAAHFDERIQKGGTLTAAERKAFSQDALDLETEYARSKEALGDRQKEVTTIRAAAARYELENQYVVTHPVDARFGSGLKAIRDSKTADSAALNTLFDGSMTGRAPTPVKGLPPGPAVPIKVKQGTPPAVRIRYEAELPADKKRKTAWLATHGAEKEKKFVEDVLAGLKTPTERAVLERLAANQAAYETYRAVQLAQADSDLKAAEKALKKAQATGSQVLASTYVGLVNARKRDKEAWENKSPELLVSMRDMDDAAGKAYWDTAPAADGKIHLRLVLDRGYVLSPMIGVKNENKAYTMKVMTHELTHSADEADPEGIFWGLTERRAYLNEAKAYREEGEPKEGLAVHEKKIEDALRRDPVVWTVGHLSTHNYIESGNLLRYVTADDVRDPAAGMRWRMMLAYDYAARQQPSLQDAFKKMELGPDLVTLALQVSGDYTIAGSRKAQVFADKAMASRTAGDWMDKVKGMSAQEKARLQQQQAAYWKDLGAFYLSR